MISKVKTTAITAGILLILPATVAFANVYEEAVARQLIRIALIVLGADYSPTHEPEINRLNAGDYTYHRLTLYQGVSQKIVGVCDQDCSDIDLWLYDENNNLVDSDTDSDDTPVVSANPRWTGSFKVKVKMYDCEASYCHYGIGVFGN